MDSQPLLAHTHIRISTPRSRPVGLPFMQDQRRLGREVHTSVTPRGTLHEIRAMRGRVPQPAPQQASLRLWRGPRWGCPWEFGRGKATKPPPFSLVRGYTTGLRGIAPQQAPTTLPQPPPRSTRFCTRRVPTMLSIMGVGPAGPKSRPPSLGLG